MSPNLSHVVVSPEGDRLITVKQAAVLTETSVTVVERFVVLGLVEPVGNNAAGARFTENYTNYALAKGSGAKLSRSGNGVGSSTGEREAKSATASVKKTSSQSLIPIEANRQWQR